MTPKKTHSLHSCTSMQYLSTNFRDLLCFHFKYILIILVPAADTKTSLCAWKLTYFSLCHSWHNILPLPVSHLLRNPSPYRINTLSIQNTKVHILWNKSLFNTPTHTKYILLKSAISKFMMMWMKKKRKHSCKSISTSKVQHVIYLEMEPK